MLDDVFMKLDLTRNTKDIIVSLFYEKEMYACFLKVLLSQSPPDYFTGLNLLVGRLMRHKLDQTSEEWKLTMSILFSVYGIDADLYSLKSFDGLSPTADLDSWVMNPEIRELLIKTGALSTMLLYAAIFSPKIKNWTKISTKKSPKRA